MAASSPRSSPAAGGVRARARTALRPVRRVVLRRRRLLAALCVGTAVLAGLRSTSDPAPVTVAVPVLARDVAAGTVLGAADVTRVAYAPDSVPPGLVADPTGRTVATSVARGEPVTTTRLVGAALVRAAPGVTAMPVRFPDAAMAALLRVGDVLDVLAVDPQGGSPAVVARGARVLALPATGSSGADRVAGTGGGTLAPATDGLPGRLAVLAVPPADVARVSDASVRLFLTYAYAH